uniref:Putative lipocalin-7 1 n=1 Tax=Amblyomma tuberculatum TaxID=48802 RepID=A0A6M2E808_9ACAR
MAAFRAIMIWTLVAMTASHDDSDMPPELNTLLGRINPWKVANSSQTVYLTKASMQISALPSPYCVSSDYLRYEAENRTAYRTLYASFVNASHTFHRSVNISLQVRHEKWRLPTLLVGFLYNIYGILPSSDPNAFVQLDEYELQVAYSDSKCLILRNPPTKGRQFGGCTMWTPEEYVKKRPLCCEFLFFVLCGVSTITYDRTSCATNESASAA